MSVPEAAVIPPELAEAITRAAGLIDDLDEQTRCERVAYTEGYTDGWAAGYAVGEGSVYERIAEGSRLAAGAIPRGSPFVELVRRRAEPGEAAEQWRARHGGEHQGGPVAWGPPPEGGWRPPDYPHCARCGWPPNDRQHCCRYRTGHGDE